MTTTTVVVKRGSARFPLEVSTAAGVVALKATIAAATTVPAERQQLFAKAWPGALKDDVDLSSLPFAPRMAVALLVGPRIGHVKGPSPAKKELFDLEVLSLEEEEEAKQITVLMTTGRQIICDAVAHEQIRDIKTRVLQRLHIEPNAVLVQLFTPEQEQHLSDHQLVTDLVAGQNGVTLLMIGEDQPLFPLRLQLQELDAQQARERTDLQQRRIGSGSDRTDIFSATRLGGGSRSNGMPIGPDSFVGPSNLGLGPYVSVATRHEIEQRQLRQQLETAREALPETGNTLFAWKLSTGDVVHRLSASWRCVDCAQLSAQTTTAAAPPRSFSAECPQFKDPAPTSLPPNIDDRSTLLQVPPSSGLSTIPTDELPGYLLCTAVISIIH